MGQDDGNNGATRAQLANKIIDAFNISELKQLCFELGIDYQRLEGNEKGAKVVALILYVERRGRVDDLLQACRRLRPGHAWPQSLVAAARDTSLPERGAEKEGDTITQEVSASGHARIGSVTQTGKQEERTGWLGRLMQKWLDR